MQTDSFRLIAALSLLLNQGGSLAAQTPTVDQFLKGLAPHSRGDQAEHELDMKVYLALGAGPANEAANAVPAIFDELALHDDREARFYAEFFLLAIALRPDRASLLSGRDMQMAALLTDSDEQIQKVALDLMYWTAGNHREPYLTALKAAMQMSNLSQETQLKIANGLVHFGSKDKDSLQVALKFMKRDDLTPDTWRGLTHALGTNPNAPEDVCKELVRALDNPNAGVRAAAIVDFAYPTSSVHLLALPHFEKMAQDDPNKQVRVLAKDALAGKTPLNPNIEPDPPK